VMNFKADSKVVDDYKEAIDQIKSIQEKYKKIAKFK